MNIYRQLFIYVVVEPRAEVKSCSMSKTSAFLTWTEQGVRNSMLVIVLPCRR